VSSSVTVRIPTPLRGLTAGAAQVSAPSGDLAAVIAALEADHPGVAARLLDEAGELRRFVNVYVGEDDVRFLAGLATSCPGGVTVSIVPAVAGG